ncbi:hypothetical protein L596_011656 [Steinernema carpocapsae]|uniref:Uncharacterized protein n=1 Tax=Steinernema carpocapsae TaxID=34508 RepID=A0A4U5NVI5_STECR|nr:hypothetical protein L596_011656 [Steinernema carpocapsae]
MWLGINNTYQILHSHVKSIEKTEYADFSLSAASPKLDFISTSPSEPERLLTILEICDISNSQFTYYSKLYFVSKIRVPAYKKVNDFCTYEAIVTDGSVTSDGRLRCSCVEIIGKRENVAWKPLKSIEGYFHMFYDGLLIKFRTMSNMIKTSTSEELPDEQLDRQQAFVRM